MSTWMMPFPSSKPHSSSVAIVNGTQYLQAVHCWKAALKMTLIYYIIVVVSMTGQSQASPIKLLPCPDSAPPCMHDTQLTHNLCQGENGYVTIKIEIPIHQIPLLTTGDITVCKGSEPIIRGLTKNPNFQSKDRWKMSQMISDVTNISGILTLITQVDDAQAEDEFLSNIEIRLRDQTVSTSDEIWFPVNADCSASSTHQEYVTRVTPIPNELNASVQHPQLSMEDINIEMKEPIKDMKNDIAEMSTSLSQIRIMLIIVILMFMFAVAVCGLRMWYIRYKHRKVTLKTECRNKDTESSPFERQMLAPACDLNKLGNESFSDSNDTDVQGRESDGTGDLGGNGSISWM